MKILTKVAKHPCAEIIFAHGAGAGKDSEFMQQVADMFAANNVQISVFDFPYMQKAQALGKRQPPNKMPILQQDFLEVIEQRRSALPLFIGGKSMGGRVATMIADQANVQGVVCFGYPFHPPGKPEKTRTEHLYHLETDVQIVQGQRDTFGTAEDIASYTLPKKIQITLLDSADHSFKPLKSSGLTLQQHMHTAVTVACQFIQEHL